MTKTFEKLTQDVTMVSLNDLPLKYRIQFMFYRALLIAFFYNPEKVNKYASEMHNCIRFGTNNLKG